MFLSLLFLNYLALLCDDLKRHYYLFLEAVILIFLLS